MDAILREFAEDADMESVNRLIALSEITKAIPTDKMAKAKKVSVQWSSIGGELMPNLDMEFYE
jgi:hypothetical protein